MVKVSKKDKNNNTKKKRDLRNFFHPKLAIFLSSAPFMLLCPFIILGVLTGWPIEPWMNNDKISDYERAFSEIPYPEDVSKIGTIYSEIGGFNSIQGECDLIAARLITSEDGRDDVASRMLKQYQTYVDTSAIKDPRPEGFDYLFNSSVKLFEVNKDEDIFNNDELNVMVRDAFNINSFASDQNVYVFYMVQLDVFASRDPRCTNPDKDVVKEDESNFEETSEEPTVEESQESQSTE